MSLATSWEIQYESVHYLCLRTTRLGSVTRHEDCWIWVLYEGENQTAGECESLELAKTRLEEAWSEFLRYAQPHTIGALKLSGEVRTFQLTLSTFQYYLEVANIRDSCSEVLARELVAVEALIRQLHERLMDITQRHNLGLGQVQAESIERGNEE